MDPVGQEAGDTCVAREEAYLERRIGGMAIGRATSSLPGDSKEDSPSGGASGITAPR